MALAGRKHNRRIFEKAGSGKDRMDDNKISKISASFAANVHVDHPELPDATEAMVYALQGIEEDVQELHRHISNDDLAVNITGNAATATALTAGNKTLDGNLTIDTGHTLTAPFLKTYQINPPSGTDTDLNIRSNGNILFTLDDNTNEGGQSFTFRNHNGYGTYTNMLTLDESGHFTLYGAIHGDPHIKLYQNTNTSTSGPPILEFYRNASYQDNSNLGLIQFKGKNVAGTPIPYAEISGISEETGTGTEGGKLEFKIASHDGEMVTGLKIEDGVTEDDVDITIGSTSLTNTIMNGSVTIGSGLSVGSNLSVPTLTNSTMATFQSTVRFDGTIYFSNLYDTNLARTAAGELSINSKKIVTENKSRHILNCGWNGASTALSWLPFGYGGIEEAFMYSSNSGYLEYGGFVAPCDGYVDFVVVRSENACGNTVVGVHIAPVGSEVPPSTGIYAFTSTTTNMAVDDTGYKFTNFTNSNGTGNSFNAGDVIMISFDPTIASGDSNATAVLVLDWTNTL
jgi:hypothetical protein